MLVLVEGSWVCMKTEGSRRSCPGHVPGKEAGGVWKSRQEQCPPEPPETGLRLVSIPSGAAWGNLARWLVQPAQAQLLKIRVKNLSPWLVLQEPVALATPSQRPPSRLPRLAAGLCASPLCWPLCPVLLGREVGW